MSFNDSLSDMLARIKNAHKANKSFTYCYNSKLNSNVLHVLKDEGYIRDFKKVEVRTGINNIKIELKYHLGVPVIKKIKRISKPGIRVYSKIKELSKHLSPSISILRRKKYNRIVGSVYLSFGNKKSRYIQFQLGTYKDMKDKSKDELKEISPFNYTGIF